jgi:hypothetical protein
MSLDSEKEMANKYNSLMSEIGFQYVKGRRLPASESEIKALEHVIGFSLPRDHREFIADFGLSTGNGAFRYFGPNALEV